MEEIGRGVIRFEGPAALAEHLGLQRHKVSRHCEYAKKDTLYLGKYAIWRERRDDFRYYYYFDANRSEIPTPMFYVGFFMPSFEPRLMAGIWEDKDEAIDQMSDYDGEALVAAFPKNTFLKTTGARMGETVWESEDG